MEPGTWGLALAAGMLAAVNPCGFALLPAYLSLLVLGDEPTARARAVGRAVATTAAMTGGFVAVFGAFGLVLGPAASGIQRHLPWVTVGLGVALVAAGGWVLAGRSLPGLPTTGAVSTAPVRQTAVSMFGYGAGYALASLSCTIAPFLAIVVAAGRSSSWLTAGGAFLGYAVGMGLVVGAAAVAVALARPASVARLRRIGPVLGRFSGGLLALVGGYVTYYGWHEVRLLRGDQPQDPVIDAASSAQRWLATVVGGAGPAVFVAVVAAASAVATATALRRRSGSGNPRDGSG
ncbi:cytochrome c biogenesis CcdA family protein [Pilimelia columellifera]|uniref:Cytochrome c biogenesis CcdA family protein n=1 Tax=Pilimelia columellifera subsp. columellifera TaxID=706583 RepID=A0ABP6AA30_9ACTN